MGRLKRGYQSNTFSSEGEATKSAEGSAWISFASSRIRRTPGDLVLRGIIVDGERASRELGDYHVVTLRSPVCIVAHYFLRLFIGCSRQIAA